YPKQDHPELALSLNNLASMLHDQGKYADAEPLFNEALSMYRALGEKYAVLRSEGDALTLASSYPRTRDAFLSNARKLQAARAAAPAPPGAGLPAAGACQTPPPPRLRAAAPGRSPRRPRSQGRRPPRATHRPPPPPGRPAPRPHPSRPSHPPETRR